ncbi:unnamed protein product [Ectocarpus sp. 13 AM-2016]
MSTSRDTGVQATRVGGDDVGKAAAVEVVVGVLSFESLREGDVAVSSLFLKDETGRVRLVCAPPPPPSWLGQVVCLTRWTLTTDKTPTAGKRKRQVECCCRCRCRCRNVHSRQGCQIVVDG